MEQKILKSITESKALRYDGKRNFVVFYTPEEKKTVEYLEFCEANPGLENATDYLLGMSSKDTLDIKCIMDIYAKKIIEGGM